MIRQMTREEIPQCVEVIRESFLTVAREFGFTRENAPRFTAFAVDEERLGWQLEEGRPMFVYRESGEGIIGYVSLHVTGDGVCELNNLCVLPQHRHRYVGTMLYEHAVRTARALGCGEMKIGIVEENVRLRSWYEKLGARHVGTEKFDFFPFTCGYLTVNLKVGPMKRKRLDRDLWGFQGFPYCQMRLDCEDFHGLASMIRILSGDYQYWELPLAGRIPVCGEGMVWLQLIPDGTKSLVTVMYYPEAETLEGVEYPFRPVCWYVDVTEGWEYGEDGVALYTDKYLDIIFSPQGDVGTDDRDELDAALACGEITREQYESALAEEERVRRELCQDIPAVQRRCARILARMLEKIRRGERGFTKNWV